MVDSVFQAHSLEGSDLPDRIMSESEALITPKLAQGILQVISTRSGEMPKSVQDLDHPSFLVCVKGKSLHGKPDVDVDFFFDEKTLLDFFQQILRVYRPTHEEQVIDLLEEISGKIA